MKNANTKKTGTKVYGNPFVIALGKVVRVLARLKGGSGSAIPGVVVDKIAPAFAPKVLGSLPFGVVVVSGTNGKTTTTKIVAELLESQGLRVFTNSSGSNFMRGVVASLLSEISLSGRLNADIAVLELDEAHAVHFVKRVAPRYSLLINVMPDQLDRFGTIEYTASLLKQVAERTTSVVVLNREDALLAKIAGTNLQARALYFGLGEVIKERYFNALGLPAPQEYEGKANPTILLEEMHKSEVSFRVETELLSTSLALKGLHNAYNCAGALALVREILPNKSREQDTQMVKALSAIESAFGRGESFVLDGIEIEMLLVKNAGGFSLALESFDSEDCMVMIVVNDEAGDGRDVSWLFDVDFTLLKDNDVAMLSGSRAHDMALRLSYDEVSYRQIVPDPIDGLNQVLSNAQNQQKPLYIYCTYTAMMRLRPSLVALTNKGLGHIAATDSLPTHSKQVIL